MYVWEPEITRDPQLEAELEEAPDAVRWAEERLGLEVDGKQAMVLDRGVKRGILNCSRQWGKSTIAAARAVYEAVYFKDSLVLVASPCARQSGEFLRKAEGFVRKLGMVPRGDGDNALSLEFGNGSRIVGLPGQEATVRGFSAAALLLIDEASRVPDELYQALRPVLAVSNGGLWLLSTPAGQRGFFWEEWERGGEEWLRVSAPATECPRIAAEFLEKERKTQGARQFAQEYLCEFHEEEGTAWGRELVEGTLDETVRPWFK